MLTDMVWLRKGSQDTVILYSNSEYQATSLACFVTYIPVFIIISLLSIFADKESAISFHDICNLCKNLFSSV